MSAIKFPVQAIQNGMWWVTDADGVSICNTGASSYLAREIAIRLNSHDTLVQTLNLMCHSKDVGAIARAALAKVESIKDTP